LFTTEDGISVPFCFLHSGDADEIHGAYSKVSVILGDLFDCIDDMRSLASAVLARSQRPCRVLLLGLPGQRGSMVPNGVSLNNTFCGRVAVELLQWLLATGMITASTRLQLVGVGTGGAVAVSITAIAEAEFKDGGAPLQLASLVLVNPMLDIDTRCSSLLSSWLLALQASKQLQVELFPRLYAPLLFSPGFLDTVGADVAARMCRGLGNSSLDGRMRACR